MTNTVTQISATTAGEAVAQFLKANAVLHTHGSLTRADVSLPESVFDAIGVLIDARIAGVGGKVFLQWVPSLWPTSGNQLTLANDDPFSAALGWITNDSRSVLISLDKLNMPTVNRAFTLVITDERVWLNDDTIWRR